MKKVFFLFIIMLMPFINVVAQTQFNIDYNEMKGELTQSDKYKKDFGKYHGYELPLYEGETANFALFSNEFNAKLILVNPEGKVYKQSTDPANGFTSIITQIPASGDWILYVVGDKKDEGKFILRYAFAEANSMNIPANMDFCSVINFLVAHANAHFMMLQGNETSKDGFPKLPGTKEAFIDAEKGGYVNIIFSGKERTIKQNFEEYSGLLKNCLPDWKVVKNDKGEKGKLRLQNLEKITIELEYSPVPEVKDEFELIMQVYK